ncbi:MAG: DUF3108 domain-containing protein [Lysobacteraceae bacterium]
MPRFPRVLLFAALMASGADAAPVPAFSERYEVRRNGDRLGEATLSLEVDERGGRLAQRTEGTAGLARILGVRIDERSTFAWRPDGRPETREYAYDQSTSVNQRRRGARVDAGTGTIRLTDKGEVQDVPYVDGVVDRQLLTLALMQAVAAGRRGELVFRVVGRRAVEDQTWRIGAEGEVPGGGRGVRIERIRQTADGRRTVLWLDPRAPHVPLRIEQHEDDGESVEMRRLATRGAQGGGVSPSDAAPARSSTSPTGHSPSTPQAVANIATNTR